MGPNFQAAHMATTQKTTDTASRTNPRNSPTMVEPNRTKTIKASAPVNVYSQKFSGHSQALRATFNGVEATPAFQALRAMFNGVEATPSDRLCINPAAFYRSGVGGVVKRASQTPNQGAGATKLAACPADFSFATVWAAAPRSAMGPMRTRYRREGPEPPGTT